MLTRTEKTILKNTDSKYKYIVRDYSNYLYIYEFKPIKHQSYWDVRCVITSSLASLKAFNHLFKSVQWTNKEPLQFRNEKGEFIL